MKTFQHLTSEPVSLLLLPGHHFVSAEISALQGTMLQMNGSLYLYSISHYSLAGSISWSLICFTHDSTLFDGQRHIVGASQEIDCTGACWLNAGLKYFLPQQILSVFPHLIHQTSTEMGLGVWNGVQGYCFMILPIRGLPSFLHNYDRS